MEQQKATELEMERKEKILDKIREQVRIEAPVDPSRIAKNTKSWKSKVLADRPVNYDIFQTNSYSDKQVFKY